MITLTSFRDAKNHQGTKYSVARWQPRGCTYKTIHDLTARDELGNPLRCLSPEEFIHRYYARLEQYGKPALIALATTLGTSVLLCWCNPSRQRGYPHLFCHTVLIGWWLEKHYPGVEVVYADGREREWFGDARICGAVIP